ncbi:MAG: class I SAM-dependent methyltransferase [Bacteriovoracaceae bacterium]|nr:class I SAM-dependent methyltransferase [Bacteriovoracaceae bacterium]
MTRLVIFLFTLLYSCTHLDAPRSPASIDQNRSLIKNTRLCHKEAVPFVRHFAISSSDVKFELFMPEKNYRGGQGMGVTVNKIIVTGDTIYYALPEMLKALKIDAKQVAHWKSNKAVVLSLGEGLSGLLPHLRSKGVDVYGLDIWYHSSDIPTNNYVGTQMIDYLNKYGDHLIRGSSSNIPVADSSIDVIVAHKLVNNLSVEDGLATLSEIKRVLAPHGEVRIFGILGSHKSAIKKYLKKHFTKTHKWSFTEGTSSMRFSEAGDKSLEESGTLLLIKPLTAP